MTVGISSISEFLLEAGTEYRVVDMGRTFHLLPEQTFLEIENGEVASKYPRQQYFWCGILFWNKQLSEQHYIWFLKFPLDENGKVVNAHRDQFLSIIVEALGAQFVQSEKQHELPDNPYQFTPSQQQIADFNATAKLLLQVDETEQHRAAAQYLASPFVLNWEELSIQGLSDCCANINNSDIANSIVKHYADYPFDVKRQLCTSLENHLLPDELQDSLLKHLQALLNQEEFNWRNPESILLLRATNQAENKGPIKQLLLDSFDKASDFNPDTLLVIAGRYWDLMAEEDFALAFSEKCAEHNLFEGVFPDLVQIPSIRHTMLGILRAEKRSPSLSRAIGNMFA